MLRSGFPARVSRIGQSDAYDLFMVSKHGPTSRTRRSGSASMPTVTTQGAQYKALEEGLDGTPESVERHTSAAFGSSAQAKTEMDARTERRARAMLEEGASLPAPTKGDAELADQLSEKARVAWTTNGLLIQATELAAEWAISRRALDE